MRKLRNTEIANFVFEKMEKMNKDYEISYDKILGMVDGSIENDTDIEKDENGEILNKMSEKDIETLKNNMLNGIEEYFDSINEKF